MATAIALHLFDLWQPRYGGSTVTVYQKGTTTKATLYDGEDTATAGTLANPQTLDSQAFGGVVHGKWNQPVYVAEDVDVEVDGEDTGIVKLPVFGLSGEDGSQLDLTLTGQSTARDLRDWAADRIDVGFYGAFGGAATATQNTTTLNAAIAAANSNGGGFVDIPAGTYELDGTITPSARVVIRGQGRGVTTLQAQMGSDLIALQNSGAGLMGLTLDGVNKTALSVGIEIEETSDIVLSDVQIKRFVTGIDVKSLQESRWYGVYVSDCTTGVDFTTDSGNVDGDDLIRDIFWYGGQVELCSTDGLHVEHQDAHVRDLSFLGVNFDDNTGTALRVIGGQYLSLMQCKFNGNTNTINLSDVASPSGDQDDIVVGFECASFFIDQGDCDFADTCSLVKFRNGEVSAGTWTFTAVDNNITFIDVTEGASFSLSGTTTRLMRQLTGDTGYVTGQTSGSAATKAWAMTLLPGETAMLRAQVTAVRQDGDKFATFDVSAGARRPPSTLDYDTQTANFTAGATLTGGTSGATAVIVEDDDGGLTGTLKLINIVGEFQNNEVISDGSGGSALADGTLTEQDVIVGRGVRDTINPLFATERSVDADFAAAASEVELQITGLASQTWNWRCRMDVLRS